MIVFPAIDLKAGEVVRLAEGDMERATVYGDNPAGQRRTGAAEPACRARRLPLRARWIDPPRQPGRGAAGRQRRWCGRAGRGLPGEPARRRCRRPPFAHRLQRRKHDLQQSAQLLPTG
ncbi:hypothetical protein J4558_12050 [Leptolyngbya sp. 15MV]|nr:hypothetical protein J4558_12050 [Leptolyngbya sp. 15MV]